MSPWASASSSGVTGEGCRWGAARVLLPLVPFPPPTAAGEVGARTLGRATGMVRA